MLRLLFSRIAAGLVLTTAIWVTWWFWRQMPVAQFRLPWNGHGFMMMSHADGFVRLTEDSDVVVAGFSGDTYRVNFRTGLVTELSFEGRREPSYEQMQWNIRINSQAGLDVFHSPLETFCFTVPAAMSPPDVNPWYETNRHDELLVVNSQTETQHVGEIWDLKAQCRRLRVENLYGRLALSPDGTRAAAKTDVDHLVVWDLPSVQELIRLPSNNKENSYTFAPDGRFCMAHDEPTYVTIWSPDFREHVSCDIQIPYSTCWFVPEFSSDSRFMYLNSWQVWDIRHQPPCRVDPDPDPETIRAALHLTRVDDIFLSR